MKVSRKQILFLSVFLILLLFATHFALALEVTYPRVPGADPPQDFLKTGISEGEVLYSFVKYIFVLLIWVSGAIALVMLTIAGVRYLISSGKAEEMKSAKDQFFAVFFGLLILFSSILILKVINPSIPNLTIPTIEAPSPTATLTPLPDPPQANVRSVINAEVPFGTIIEKGIFESQVPQAEIGKRKSRMERIRDIASSVKALGQLLKDQSIELQKLTEQCTCNNSDMSKEPKPCCWLDNPGEGCIDNVCRNKPGCTSDPCYMVRGKIQELEQKNLEALFLGTNITIQGKDNKQTTVKTSLVQELTKANEEIRLIKEEIKKLEEAKQFMLECPLNLLGSLAEALFNKDFYDANDWQFMGINFWEKINPPQEWATLYCPVSGSILGEQVEVLPEDLSTLPLNFGEDIAQGETSHCTEVAIGEIIDRSERLGNKIVERLEKLIDLGEQEHNAVDYLHVLVSQCSSQRCYSFCDCQPCDEDCCDCGPAGDCCCQCIKRCGDNSWQYPEGACPKTEIKNQLQKIVEIFDGKGQQNNNNYQEGITGVTSAPKQQNNSSGQGAASPQNDPKERIGIITIIDQVVPYLLADLDRIIRFEMKTCVTDVPPEKLVEDPNQPQLVLPDCESAIGALGEASNVEKCCLEETDYQNCLYQCYLETNMTQTDVQKDASPYAVALNGEYKTCLNNCLNATGGEIQKCKHQINFYCCGE